jgi:hypothetical protein
LPDVDYEHIGDYIDLGYEYISSKNISNNMEPCKSEKNRQIIDDILVNSTKEYFKNIIANFD